MIFVIGIADAGCNPGGGTGITDPGYNRFLSKKSMLAFVLGSSSFAG
jgi:hypothetical protein